MFYYTLFYYRFDCWHEYALSSRHIKQRIRFIRKNTPLFPQWAIRRNRDGVIIAQSKNYKGM